jgi:hypothetical protein
VPYQNDSPLAPDAFTTGRGMVTMNIERPFGDRRLVLATTAAGVAYGGNREDAQIPFQELVYFGGPVSAPGYTYHSLISTAGFSQRVEYRVPVPFIPFSLGRFGRVPGRGSLAPFAHVVGVQPFTANLCGSTILVGCQSSVSGFYPSAGVAYLTPFDLIRLEVARGFRGHQNQWMFNIDVSREFWPIL